MKVSLLQVVSMKRISPQEEASSFQAEAASPLMQPHLTSAAMRRTAPASEAQPTAKVTHTNKLNAAKLLS